MFPSLSFPTSRLPKLSRSLNATGLGDGNLLGGNTVQYGGSTTSTRKRKKALLIGINYATHPDLLKRLTKPQSDVDVMTRLLGMYDYKMEDIVTMTDARNTQEHLIPTKDNIIQQMISLVADVKEGDEFFLYYAGHADQRPEESPGNERDNKDEYIIPLDGFNEEGEPVMDKVIADDKLREILVQPLIHADIKCQLIALMDACTSGTLLDLEHDECNKVVGFKSLLFRIVRSLLETSPETNSIFRARIAEWLKDPKYDCNRICNRKMPRAKANIVCISACEDSQTLIETPLGKTLGGTLDDYLRNRNKRPTLKKLNRVIHDEFQRNYQVIQRSYDREMKRYKKGKRKEPPRELPRRLGKPQVSSTRPLRMNTTLKL